MIVGVVAYVTWRAFLLSAVQARTPDRRQLDFPTSGSPEAQKAFLRGVVWLHSFEYEEAEPVNDFETLAS